mgnify:CR=1 FL=1
MSAPKSSRDLVLGLVHGYPAAMARPFLDSLRRVAPHAEVILASSEISAATRDELRARRCTLLPYRYYRARFFGRKIWPGNTRWARLHTRYAAWINALPGLTAEARLLWRARTVRHFLDPNTRRFVEFYLALRHVLPDCDRVLLSDIRDVVFQADPFALITEPGILYGLEDASVTIGSHWANSLWVERVGGATLRDALAPERVSCVGVVLGSGPVIAAYLALVVDALTSPGINVANFHGADTGAHNIVVRRRALPNVRFADFENGGIVNLHGLNPASIRWTADDLLSDAHGRPFAVVHQYDRHPEVASRLLARLGVAPAEHKPSDLFFHR